MRRGRCQVRVTPPGTIHSTLTPGMTFYRHTEGVDVRWSFDDGVEVHVRTPVPVTTYHGRRRDTTPQRELERKPRVYVDYGVPFDVLEDLVNRGRRPHRLFRDRVTEALERVGLEGSVHWSQKAGCSCGCSPGFILTTDVAQTRGLDVWVTLPGAPRVDESIPPRVIADPTILEALT